MQRKLANFVTALFGVCTFVGSQPSYAAPTCIADSKIGKQLNLPIYEWVDNTKPRKGTIIAVPGMTLYAYSWNDMANFLAARGYDVFSLDERGFGRWQTDAAKYGGTNKIEIGQSQQDLLDLVTDLRQAHPKQKLYCLGESVGSNLALTLIAEHPELTDGAILGSPCYKTRMHAKPLRWAADFARTIVKPNRLINLEPYAAPYLTNDPAVAKACDNDPLIYRKITAPELIKIDVMDDRAIAAAKDLKPGYPLLIIAGTKDAMFKSTELPKAIEKFGTRNIQLRLLAGKGHLLMEHQPVQPVIGAVIESWLGQQYYLGSNAAPPPATPSTKPPVARPHKTPVAPGTLVRHTQVLPTPQTEH